MAGSREDREAVRDYVVELFERWRAQQIVVRGEGIAEFARAAGVPDASLRVWLGRAGPKKRELVNVPSAPYLLRLIRAAGSSTVAPQPIGDDALAACLESLADQLGVLRSMLEERRPPSEELSQSEQVPALSVRHL